MQWVSQFCYFLIYIIFYYDISLILLPSLHNFFYILSEFFNFLCPRKFFSIVFVDLGFSDFSGRVFRMMQTLKYVEGTSVKCSMMSLMCTVVARNVWLNRRKNKKIQKKTGKNEQVLLEVFEVFSLIYSLRKQNKTERYHRHISIDASRLEGRVWNAEIQDDQQLSLKFFLSCCLFFNESAKKMSSVLRLPSSSPLFALCIDCVYQVAISHQTTQPSCERYRQLKVGKAN